MITNRTIVTSAGQTALATRQFCSFRVAGRLYGADILKVKEITGETNITPVFHAPSEVKGIVNIRGQISLVLDLRLMLGFEPQSITTASRIVLLKPEACESFGLLVDAIGDVIAADESMIEWRRSHEELGGVAGEHRCSLETGVCKLEKSLLVILDPSMALRYIQAKTQI